jgi:hypothetical protein
LVDVWRRTREDFPQEIRLLVFDFELLKNSSVDFPSTSSLIRLEKCVRKPRRSNRPRFLPVFYTTLPYVILDNGLLFLENRSLWEIELAPQQSLFVVILSELRGIELPSRLTQKPTHLAGRVFNTPKFGTALVNNAEIFD